MSETPTDKIIVFHFASGDEHIENTIFDFCSQFGAIEEIYLYPGVNYAYIRFENKEQSEILISSLT